MTMSWTCELCDRTLQLSSIKKNGHRCKFRRCQHCQAPFNSTVKRDLCYHSSGLCVVKVNRWGEESLSHVDLKDPRVVVAIRDDLMNALDIVYFDGKHPENRTLRKTNRSNDVLELYVDGWTINSFKQKLGEVKRVLARQLRVDIVPDSWNRGSPSKMQALFKRPLVASVEVVAERYNQAYRLERYTIEYQTKKVEVDNMIRNCGAAVCVAIRKMEELDKQLRSKWLV